MMTHPRPTQEHDKRIARFMREFRRASGSRAAGNDTRLVRPHESERNVPDGAVRLTKPIPIDWPLEWFVATVRPGADYQAASILEKDFNKVFIFEKRDAIRVRRGSGKREMRDFPIWPGYLFVDIRSVARIFRHIDAAYYENRTSPFTGVLRTGPDIDPVDGTFMQALFMAHNAGLFVPASYRTAVHRKIKLGELVEILEGPFAHFEGIMKAFASRDRVRIETEIFGRPTDVDVELQQVRALS